ncbi:aminoglycoside phosphotransferase family protein [Thalassotalea sediminis]|uniref:aminoglycoside phosphotransferase family protein n=1 Tax=Thalassotalea sediminis TaxID=1759089 RepID=UPI00257394D5|nr:phosphotransferase [Thalassotalea sediminis]
MLDDRLAPLTAWLIEKYEDKGIVLQPLSGDAGFRKYFRFHSKGQHYIAVDAPNRYCNNQAYEMLEKRFAVANIPSLTILHVDQDRGFFSLKDLGDTLLADILTSETVIERYQEAIDLLPEIAMLSRENLPEYDRDFVQRELNIFIEWLVEHHLALTVSDQEREALQCCFNILIENILAQPQVFMHRDFHSRNLMWYQDKLAVIDFQDAVVGPVTYDIVSLLRDCYVKWPVPVVNEAFRYFVEEFGEQLIGEKLPMSQWQRWFDLTGIQRHIKAAGIFARLKHRDNKLGYMKDIPLTLTYIVEICQHYPELTPLKLFVAEKVLPHFTEETLQK